MEYRGSFFFLLQLLLAVIVFSAGLERREKFLRKLFLLFFLLFLILSAEEAYLKIESQKIGISQINWMQLISETIIWGVAFIVILTLFIRIPFCITWQEAIYTTTCAYLLEHMAYCERVLISYMFGEETMRAGSIGYFVVLITSYAGVYFLVSRHLVKDGHYVASAVNSLGLLLSTLFIVLVMSAVASCMGFTKIHAVYACFCCFFVLYGQIHQQKQMNLQKELNFREQIWSKRKEQYEMAKETVDLINQKCHDLKHQAAVIRGIDENGTKEGIAQSLEEAAGLYDAVIKTGNDTLDTVLTEHNLFFRKSGVLFTCIANGRLLDFMETMDLYALFGNALDNAAEAVMKLPEERRWVSVLLHEKAGLILIQVENPYKEIRLDKGMPVTMKEKNGYHGFGVKSIFQISEKYHGTAAVELEEQVFVLRITFPLERE